MAKLAPELLASAVWDFGSSHLFRRAGLASQLALPALTHIQAPPNRTLLLVTRWCCLHSHEQNRSVSIPTAEHGVVLRSTMHPSAFRQQVPADQQARMRHKQLMCISTPTCAAHAACMAS